MRAEWQAKSFEDCVEAIAYTKKIQRKEFLDYGEFPIVSQEDGLINGYWNEENDVLRVERPLVVFGDHTRAIKFVDFDFVLGADGVKLLSPKSFLEPRFFYYQLQAAELPELGYARHYRLLRELSISVPPLPEQRRIVAILDKAFAGIATARANAEKNLQNARALFESHLESVFCDRLQNWRQRKLDALTTKIGSGATPRGGEESYKASGVSLIRSLNVYDLGFRRQKLAFLDDDQADSLSNVTVQPNDVLLNITGASVARCCVVPEDILPARVNQHVSIIRPIAGELDAAFLHYLLISKPYKDKLLQTGEEGGSTRQAITKAQIQEFVIGYPNLSEQRQIVATLDRFRAETHRLESLYTRKLAALDGLKKSLLQEAFSGTL